MTPDGRYDLLICRFPGNNQEHPRSSGYIISLMKRLIECDSVGRIEPYTVSDTPITMGRNRAVKYALDNKFDYILMVDADMHPDLYVGKDPQALPFFPTAWDFMMRRRAMEGGPGVDPVAPATVAAPYCGPPPEENVFVFEWKSRSSDDPETNFTLGCIPRESAAIRMGFQEVAALPTGLILYDARVFASLPLPWFDYEWEDEHRTKKDTTEDVYQTRNASLLGFPQFVLWDSWAGHIKQKVVGKPKLLSPTIVEKCLREALKNPESNFRLKFLRQEEEEGLNDGEVVDS